MLFRCALLLSITALVGCAGPGVSERARTLDETKAAFARHGIKLVPYPGGNGDSTPFFEVSSYAVLVAVFPTVRAAQRHEKLYHEGSLRLGTDARSRNVFVTWSGRPPAGVVAALLELR